ncbi:MAG: hypothetical protein NTV48_03020 [Candidatus Vogelbacteria bacterium]|nr:hypothetical protein [Candidatus Vogelbacteria bacterium]
MDLKNINIKWLAVGAIVLLGAYWAYGYFTSSPPEPVGGVTVAEGAGSGLKTGVVDDPFSDLLFSLSAVDLKEKSLLSDPIFKGVMQDFSQPLPTPEVGRPNPFLPVGTNANLITERPPASAISTAITVDETVTNSGTSTESSGI